MKPNLLNLSLYVTFIVSVVCIEPKCNRPPDTPCCYNEYLDPGSNKCKECEPGRIGWKCEERCVRGYYGKLCQQKCACFSANCDPVFGCFVTMETTTSSKTNPTIQNLTRTHTHMEIRSSPTTPAQVATSPKQSRPSSPTSINTASYSTGSVSLDSNRTTTKVTPSTDRYTYSEKRRTIKAFPAVEIDSYRTKIVSYGGRGCTPLPEKERDVSDFISDSLSQLMTLVIVALFMLVLGLAFIIALLSFITWKRSKGVQIPPGMKMVSAADAFPPQQRWSTTDGGYMALGRQQRPLTLERQSGYVNPFSIETAGTSTI